MYQIDAKGPLYPKKPFSHKREKKVKNRKERRRANKNPEAQPTYKRYEGWEM